MLLYTLIFLILSEKSKYFDCDNDCYFLTHETPHETKRPRQDPTI